MIAFGSSITKPEVYRTCAERGIRRVAEADSEVYALESVGSIYQSYNRIIELAAKRDDLEALVLVHQDAEIDEGSVFGPGANGHAPLGFCEKVRQILSDPEVGVIGCVGAIGVRSIAWWEGSVTWAAFANRYQEHGGGDLPAFSWTWADAPPYAQIGEVETLDGFVLVLSPWAVHNIRFDEALTQFHGYDLDFCLQVREAGRKVMTGDFRAIHHRPLEMVPDLEDWIEAHMMVAEKWDGRVPGVGFGVGTWKERALRAEAERDAARSLAYSNELELRARASQLEAQLDEMRTSISLRLTAPLRMPARATGAFGNWRRRRFPALPSRAKAQAE